MTDKTLFASEMKIQDLDDSWLNHLKNEFSKNHMQKLSTFIRKELSLGKEIYPSSNAFFTALNLTPFEKVKVVILGQDPYHGPGQAHGLSFSVPEGMPIPPSLQNIFKELLSDLNIPKPSSGDLTNWATQGVLLLNAVLSVEKKKAASHQKKGWEVFTDKIIETLNSAPHPLVFMLWGNFAQSKKYLISDSRHCILESVHPSPLSAHRGFLGCKHFSKANTFLVSTGQNPIDWALI